MDYRFDAFCTPAQKFLYKENSLCIVIHASGPIDMSVYPMTAEAIHTKFSVACAFHN